jgi:DNA invertase Pin-like site-specific DNA recombinase
MGCLQQLSLGFRIQPFRSTIRELLDEGKVAKIKAGLARVSTEKQSFAVALSNQIQRLRDAGCTRIYADVASRTDENRDGVEALLKAVKAGEIASVTVTVLDRATGSPALFDRLTKILLQYGVPLHGIDEAIDIVSEGGEMVAGIGVVMAKMEVRKIRSRSQRGHDSKRKNSRANSNPPFGYISRDRKYAFDDRLFVCLLASKSELSKADLARDTIAIFEQVQSLSAAIKIIHTKYGITPLAVPRAAGTGHSFILEDEETLDTVQISRTSNRAQFSWTHKGLRNWLFNPVLRGHTSYGTRKMLGLDECGRREFSGTLPQEQWDIRRDTHPESVMLTDANYHSFKAIIEINSRTRSNTQKWIDGGQLRYPISGLIYCAECGGKSGAQGTKYREGQWRSYYKCRNAMSRSCSQTCTVRNDRIESAIVEALVKAAKEVEQFRHTEVIQTTIASPELSKLRDQLSGLMALGQNPIIADAITEIRLQIKKLEFAENSKIQTTERIREDLSSIFSDSKYWEYALSNDEAKTRLFQQFVHRVVTLNGEVTTVELHL